MLTIVQFSTKDEELSRITAHFGKAWYVEVDGDNDNDGDDPLHPFATITRGVEAAASGDVVLVGAGTHKGSRLVYKRWVG